MFVIGNRFYGVPYRFYILYHFLFSSELPVSSWQTCLTLMRVYMTSCFSPIQYFFVILTHFGSVFTIFFFSLARLLLVISVILSFFRNLWENFQLFDGVVLVKFVQLKKIFHLLNKTKFIYYQSFAKCWWNLFCLFPKFLKLPHW